MKLAAAACFQYIPLYSVEYHLLLYAFCVYFWCCCRCFLTQRRKQSATALFFWIVVHFRVFCCMLFFESRRSTCIFSLFSISKKKYFLFDKLHHFLLVYLSFYSPFILSLSDHNYHYWRHKFFILSKYKIYTFSR